MTVAKAVHPWKAELPMDVMLLGISKEDKLVTMFANANDKVKQARHRSRGLRAPCREAPPRCFS